MVPQRHHFLYLCIGENKTKQKHYHYHYKTIPSVCTLNETYKYPKNKLALNTCYFKNMHIR